MNKIAIVLLAVSSALAGCAVTRDGVRVGTGGAPSQGQADQVRAQLESSAKTHAAKAAAEGALDGDIKPGVIMVGTLGPLREADEETLRKGYKKGYLKGAEMWHPGKPPALSEDDFVAQVRGWTTVETFSIPGVMNSRHPALVPRRFDGDFASTFGSFMLGTTGDLVVAKTNDDAAYLLTQVLCKGDAPAYRDCAAKYERGRFDANTGDELGSDMKPKNNGVAINTGDYTLRAKAH